ncbi:AzlC family ABC transporter permease [Paracoccus sp. (in: a-proteobacteria)]|uniref:AzlC family ABC transporter permease n=1 Tax=Paracoccus sp. TaxID=267 RepID=UPI00289E4A69|nr:AzlC family ABC transporter permease [Paracoccus sp. (in: a-proteobacteria)]
MSPIPQPSQGAKPRAQATGLTAAQDRVLSRSLRQCFFHAIVQSLPFLLVLLPFGLLFGVVAVDAGLDLMQVAGFSTLVLAGASQFTAVQLMLDQAPVIVVIISALAVNLRLAMYSAALVPWLGAASLKERGLIAYLLVDQTYGLAVQHYELHPKLRLDQRMAYFFGASLAMGLPWVVVSLIGAKIGKAIPESWPLDFAVPITFLAMIAPMVRKLAHLAAVVVSIVASLVFSFLPSGLGLLIAAPLAMAAGAAVEVWTERRKALGLAPENPDPAHKA